MRKLIIAAATALAAMAAITAPADASVRHFRNCTAMHKVYPHGIAKSRAAAKAHGWKRRCPPRSTRRTSRWTATATASPASGTGNPTLRTTLAERARAPFVVCARETGSTGSRRRVVKPRATDQESSRASRRDDPRQPGHGSGWIRTNVGNANGFTARPL